MAFKLIPAKALLGARIFQADGKACAVVVRTRVHLSRQHGSYNATEPCGQIAGPSPRRPSLGILGGRRRGGDKECGVRASTIYLLTKCPWTGYLTSLNISLPICARSTHSVIVRAKTFGTEKETSQY